MNFASVPEEGLAATNGWRRCCRSDFAAPIDLRWPEYIQTVRGEEWWLPTPAVGSGAGELLHDGGARA